MSDHDSFLAEIFANADDDAPRLVYADWLAEHGDPRGEFIHLQIQRAALKHGSSQVRRLRKRELELLRENEDDWVGPFADLAERYEFRRGFVSHVKLGLSRFLKCVDELFQHAPIDSLILRLGASRTRQFFEVPQLRKLRSLVLKKSRLDEAAMRAFQDCGHFEDLRHAEFDQCELSPHGCRVLAETHLPNLKSLDLSGNTAIGGEGATAIVEKLTWLEMLSLCFCYTGDEAAAAVAGTAMPSLRNLGLGWCDISRKGVAQLAKATGLKSLRRLDLSVSKGAVELADSELTNLEELDLSHTHVSDADLEAFIKSETLGNLRRLILNAVTGPTSRSIRALARSPFLGQLERLCIQFPGMRKDDVLTLVESEYIQRPGVLDVGGYYLSPEDRAFLSARFGKRLGDLGF